AEAKGWCHKNRKKSETFHWFPPFLFVVLRALSFVSSQLAVHFLENLAEHGAGARPVLRMTRSRGGVQVRFARLNSRLVELRFLDCGLRGSGLGDRAAGTFQVSLRVTQSLRVLCFFGRVSPGR